MSHYTVAVVVRAETAEEAEEATEAALEPFSEHLEVDPYEEDVEPADVERALAYAEQKEQEKGGHGVDRGDPGFALATVCDWFGREVRRREDGSLFYETSWNPDGHWDWWVIGGRWKDGFQVRDGYRADVVRVADVDLVSMRQAAEKAAHAAYDDFEHAVAGMAVPPRWSEVLERHGPDKIEEARREFGESLWVQVARRGAWFQDPHEYWCVGADDPRAAFVAGSVGEVGVPYAWLQDGRWEQQGYIGMFMPLASTGSDEVARWRQHVGAKWTDLDPDLWVVNVDCHT